LLARQCALENKAELKAAFRELVFQWSKGKQNEDKNQRAEHSVPKDRAR
jgi:hypothetical protein